MSNEKLSNEAKNPALNKGAVMQCSVLVTKHDGSNYWKDEQCAKSAKFTVSYKISSHGSVYEKQCCTQHKKKLVKEIEEDAFAVLISIQNIA